MGASQAGSGLLVVIEGIDGAGKSTLARNLAECLQAQGHHVVATREPTDGPFGRRIRALAASERDRIPADEEWRLFHEDRRIHVEELVRPALDAGRIVVQDRSWHSTVAYQGERGLERAMLQAAERRIAPDPDVLLVVDIPSDVAIDRIRSGRGCENAFEKVETLQRLRGVFVEFEGAIVLDGLWPEDQLLELARSHVDDILRQRQSLSSS
ncbi:MAG: dTMP kinase [Myxococcales bacterium]|nr:dTMP kinase [Myxococcales bacterium]